MDQFIFLGKPPTHPSLKSKGELNQNLDSNPNLREGWVGGTLPRNETDVQVQTPDNN